VSTGGGADDGGADVPAADRAGELKAD
jgi:hypothetical protein